MCGGGGCPNALLGGLTVTATSRVKHAPQSSVLITPDFSSGVVWNASMTLADVRKGTNSYYKLQLLENDHQKRYHVFRNWGRTGTTIGGTKLDPFNANLSGAQAHFMALFREKSGNDFLHKPYTKLPKFFFPLDMHYAEVEESIDAVAAGSLSRLSKPIVDLVSLLFDKSLMSQIMTEMDLDLTKMPLGQLSRAHLEKAMEVLTSLQNLLASRKKVKPAKILGVSNQFYSMIPHDFGSQMPPLIDNEELLVEKIRLLEDLLQMEVAARALSKGEAGGGAGVDPVDSWYRQLNTDLRVLEPDSEEYHMVEEYVRNTHAETHRQYGLEVEQIFVGVGPASAQTWWPLPARPVARGSCLSLVILSPRQPNVTKKRKSTSRLAPCTTDAFFGTVAVSPTGWAFCLKACASLLQAPQVCVGMRASSICAGLPRLCSVSAAGASGFTDTLPHFSPIHAVTGYMVRRRAASRRMKRG